mgnify:CR=1 FL=1
MKHLLEKMIPEFYYSSILNINNCHCFVLRWRRCHEVTEVDHGLPTYRLFDILPHLTEGDSIDLAVF